MQRVRVNSSSVASIGYDADERVLEVEFLNGSVYRYSNVPADIHAAFMRSASHGAFLANKIKGRFPYRQA